MSYELLSNKGPLRQVAFSNSGWMTAWKYLEKSGNNVIQHFISLQTPNVAVWLVLLVIIGYAVSASAQTPDATSAAIERDELWVIDYKNLDVDIGMGGEGASKVGLTEDTVRTKVELRLRQANIRPVRSPGGHTLGVTVTVVGAGFHIAIDFTRWVVWYLPDGKSAGHLATVWHVGQVGTHGSDSNYILSSVDIALDRFLNAYLKANQ